jgi:sec-independent protein translocase protein TatC
MGGLSDGGAAEAGDYLTLVMQFILAFGMTFLLPVLLLLLTGRASSAGRS